MKSKTISTNSIIEQNKDIVASDIDDEKVMMSMDKGHYYGLDSIGRCVWDLIEKPMAVSDLITALLLQFDVDRETCESDVLAFLEELNADGIVQVK
jgi:hypothetical protein